MINQLKPNTQKASMEEEADLTKKQEKLDINHDGKIDGGDLKKVREGETARIKDGSEYSWMEFTGSPIEATNDKGRTLKLNKGDKYGARKSSTGGGKFIRLVTEKDGLNKVFTCDQDLAAYLGKNSKPTKDKM